MSTILYGTQTNKRIATAEN